MAIFKEEEWPLLHVAKFDDWILSVAANQHVLGWMIIFPPSSFEDSIAHLSDKELLGFKKLGLIVEDLAREVFNAEWFNYLQQGNTVRRIHIHFQPRYSSDRVFANHTFTDRGWGGLIKRLKEDDLPPKEVVLNIVEALKDALSKKEIKDFKVEIIK